MLVSGFRMQWHSLMELDDNGFLNRRSGFESRQEYHSFKSLKMRLSAFLRTTNAINYTPSSIG